MCVSMRYLISIILLKTLKFRFFFGLRALKMKKFAYQKINFGKPMFEIIHVMGSNLEENTSDLLSSWAVHI